MSEGNALVIQAVDAGIAWLESRGNGDWWELVDVERLNIGGFDRCVLGQVFGNEESWPVPRSGRWKNLEYGWLADHGFYAGRWLQDLDEELDAEWKLRIWARRNPVTQRDLDDAVNG